MMEARFNMTQIISNCSKQSWIDWVNENKDNLMHDWLNNNVDRYILKEPILYSEDTEDARLNHIELRTVFIGEQVRLTLASKPWEVIKTIGKDQYNRDIQAVA